MRSPAPFVLSEVEALGAGPSTSLRANGWGRRPFDFAQGERVGARALQLRSGLTGEGRRPLSSVILGLTQDPGLRAVAVLALGPDFRQDDDGA